ncbi:MULTISPECIES: MerR family transcriptional regulator [unclassified Streptomyces]|uniref:MerR family transcriptional regulator n=1 Tax=unclassified Streptomyces TaxID=2593676 RepID=UPI00225294E3|nr:MULTISPECIES: MerR family transcriptional regulator [unclassified Streptomyces]MCX4631815.1 MerR family transcriptional regulator [Streptomyces sp. NBC_01443]WSW47653.1 MerR family transcriptional regulator [Streptomyces sp. NBC_01001]
MLTIGQVAAHLGVTVRAVRHYHHRGLLPEPERDVSGYRRYGADAVVALVRIKTLSDAGVPLARIEELMGASPEQFSAAVSAIDDDLKGRIRELKRRRIRIAELSAGDALFLPEEVVVLLARLREIGLSPEAVRTERDTWILLAAQYPDQVPQWARQKQVLFEDPAFQRLYLTTDQAAGWDRDDPRLEALADEVNGFGGLRTPDPDGAEPVLALDALVAVTLMAARTGKPVPAWERLIELCRIRANTG